jgi:hypothetical protein
MPLEKSAACAVKTARPVPRLHVTPPTIPSPLPLPLSPPVSPAPPGSDLSVLVIDSHAQDLLGVCLSCLGTHACTPASVRSPSLASSQHTPISEECSGCCSCCAPVAPRQSNRDLSSSSSRVASANGTPPTSLCAARGVLMSLSALCFPCAPLSLPSAPLSSAMMHCRMCLPSTHLASHSPQCTV